MIETKLIFVAVVLTAGLVGGAIALRRRSPTSGSSKLGLGNAFAAGVFLCVGLVHMLPHAAETWEGLGWHYPMASMLATVAFLLMLLIEHVFLPEHSHRSLHESRGHGFDALATEGREGIGAYVVLAALSVHSMLAGLALGAEASMASAFILFFAIFAHKSTAGFALGVSLVRSGVTRTRSWLLLGLFAVSTPAGILVGTGLEVFLEGSAERAAEASFLSLAAGTFVYVATFDILRDEFLEPGGRFSKWALVTAGAAVMGLVALFF